MDPDAINNLLDDSIDSFDDVYSSDEYLPPGMQESNHTSSDSDNISECSIGIANDGWMYDKNSKPHIFEFTGNSGLQCNLLNDDPYNYFNIFFDDELYNIIVTCINMRANNIISNGLKQNSNLGRWKDIDVDELKKFLGLTIIMGFLKFPTLRSHWSKNEEIDYHPIFGKTMSRHRYENILRCLCFYNPNSVDRSDRLHKINNITNHITTNIQKSYYPNQNLSLDESMLLWRGRLSFRQYIPSKAHKYGIKFFELCTNDGFVLDLVIYKGKGTIENDTPFTFGIVEKLMSNYFLKKAILCIWTIIIIVYL